MPVTRYEVVRTAVRLLDEVGLEGLTLRRLGAELGVRAPTLYWHVRNKRELLDLMAEALMADAIPESLERPLPGQPWWDWLSVRTTAGYHALLRHRDAALVAAGNRPTVDALPKIEAQMDVLVTAGFPPIEALQVFLTLGSYVGGCALEVQQEARRTPENLAADRDVFEHMRDEERFPNLAAATSGITESVSDRNFHYGLDLLIAGLRARHEALTAAWR